MAKRKSRMSPIRTELPFLGETTDGRITRIRNVEIKITKKGEGGYTVGTSATSPIAG